MAFNCEWGVGSASAKPIVKANQLWTVQCAHCDPRIGNVPFSFGLDTQLALRMKYSLIKS